jgi:hypothetical protein
MLSTNSVGDETKAEARQIRLAMILVQLLFSASMIGRRFKNYKESGFFKAICATIELKNLPFSILVLLCSISLVSRLWLMIRW